MNGCEDKKLLAIDPSLTCTGWALFDLEIGQLLGVGNIKSISSSFPLSQRLVDFQKRVKEVFDSVSIKSGDYLVCEAATTMVDPRATIILEQIRGMFETLAREREVIVPGRINPRSVQFEILGMRGVQISRVKVKDVAVHGAECLYGDALKQLGFDTRLSNLKKNQDIVDALLVGRLALTRIQSALQANMPVENIFEEHKRQTRTSLKKIKGLIHEEQVTD